jgi:hypothetical protein
MPACGFPDCLPVSIPRDDPEDDRDDHDQGENPDRDAHHTRLGWFAWTAGVVWCGCAFLDACRRFPAAFLVLGFGFGFAVPFATAGGPWNFFGIQ